MLSLALIGCLVVATPAWDAQGPVAPPALTSDVIQVPERLPVTPGLGSRLAAQVRKSKPGQTLAVLARGLSPEMVTKHGGRVTAQLGPVIAARVPANRVLALAASAEFIDAPQPLRRALDVSRLEIGTPLADFGEGFEAKYRGAGVLIALYDTGIDLEHPDLRQLDGPSRVVALWDQAAAGNGPDGFGFGLLCEPAAGTPCVHRDALGHGTSVAAIAASNGPQYRGVAPEADLLVASSDDFTGFVEALAWFAREAEARAQPMVVNISLVGHEGPHDGTSLEAQAIDALDHLVVVAAGNEGSTAVHAKANLNDESRLAVLRFPLLPQPRDRLAVVDVWGDAGQPLGVRAVLVNREGTVVAQTSSASVGQSGGTESLTINNTVVGEIDLDPEAQANPANGQEHVRVGVRLFNWTDSPLYLAVELIGNGRVDAWVDTPASEPAVVRFGTSAQTVDSEAVVLGDTESTLGDPASAATAVAVSAYITRTTYDSLEGPIDLGGTPGKIASFSSNGPSLAPASTGAKPDLAAPGSVLIAALSNTAVLPGTERVDTLYRAIAGTSMAAPHVAGGAALLLQARPSATREELKSALLSGARPVEGADPRFGAGRLDIGGSLQFWAESNSGCRGTPEPITWIVLLFGFAWFRRRA